MTIQTRPEREFYNGVSIRYLTPDGAAYINIVEDYPGKIRQIFFSVGKAGTSVNAWAFSLAEMTTFALQRESLHEVINKLSNITSERMVRVPNGMHIHSGPEALFLALVKYRQSLPKQKTSWHPPKINRRARV